MDIRFWAGSILILIGFIMSIVERFLGMPYFFSKDQINGVINGFVCMFIGVLVISHGILHSLINMAVLGTIVTIQQLLIIKWLKNKNSTKQ